MGNGWWVGAARRAGQTRPPPLAPYLPPPQAPAAGTFPQLRWGTKPCYPFVPRSAARGEGTRRRWRWGGWRSGWGAARGGGQSRLGPLGPSPPARQDPEAGTFPHFVGGQKAKRGGKGPAAGGGGVVVGAGRGRPRRGRVERALELAPYLPPPQAPAAGTFPQLRWGTKPCYPFVPR